MVALTALMRKILVIANEMLKTKPLPVLSTAWYNKKGEATFSDIIAFVRREIWTGNYFNDSWFDGDYVKIKPKRWKRLLDQLTQAA